MKKETKNARWVKRLSMPFWTISAIQRIPVVMITINGLATYIDDLLPQITYKKWGFEQVPQKNLTGMNFPIVEGK